MPPHCVKGGGFSWFGNEPAHQILTAYGLLEFSDMAKVHDVDPALIARAEADHVLAYLVKPIGLADLQPAISIAMRRFKELQALQTECKDLRQALTDRKVIERAKGLLMKLAGIDEQEAFQRLQQMASEKNQKLIDAAQSILAVEKAFAPRG